MGWGGGGSCSRGFGLLSMGNINLGETEEGISENLSSHNLYLTARTVALFYACILLIMFVLNIKQKC